MIQKKPKTAKTKLSKLNGNHWVEKRNIVNQVKGNSMSLQEWRFFTIYLSKINHKDTRTRLVRFRLEEFQRMMELGRFDINYLKKVMDSLLCKIVETPKETGGFRRFQLFKETELYKDENDEWYLSFDCHDRALPLLFEYKRDYFKYRLWNALRLRSINQLRMYEILKQWEYKGEKIFSVAELRDYIGIANDEYPRWERFKVRVLESCQKAIEELTDIKFTYEPYGKKGRGGKIQYLKFTITSNEKYIDPVITENYEKYIENPLIIVSPIETESESTENKYPNEVMARLAAICGNEFSVEEMTVLMKLLAMKKFADEEWETRGKFLDLSYAKMNRFATKKQIVNRFEYLQAIIEKDKKDYSLQENTQTVKSRKSKFNNFSGRKIDYAEIDRLEQEHITRILEKSKGGESDGKRTRNENVSRGAVF